MKTVVFVRHGKSSWSYNVDDKDRPLKERGINDAHLVSQYFKKKDKRVDFIYSSPAIRALHTAVIFTRNINADFDKFEISNMLYDFSGDSVLNFLKGLPEDYGSVMLFGHNYAFTSLVNELGDTYIDNVPTSGLTEIQFDVNQWNALKSGTTVQTIFPKNLR